MSCKLDREVGFNTNERESAFRNTSVLLSGSDISAILYVHHAKNNLYRTATKGVNVGNFPHKKNSKTYPVKQNFKSGSSGDKNIKTH